MRQFYNTHRKIFYSLFFLLCLGTGFAKGAADPFEITEKCVQSPYCAENGTVFTEASNSLAVGWLWTFEDGTTATTRSTIKPYLTPGNHSVTLTRTFSDGSTTTEIQDFTIGQIPPAFKDWKIEETICPGEILTLDPYKGVTPPANATYLWSPNGETTQTIGVDKSNCYSVEVKIQNDPNDPTSVCRIENLVNVKICMEPANQQGAKWYFGENAGLDFGNTPPKPLTDGKLNTKEGSSSISNNKGDLLFYSDGVKIFDKEGNEMPCNNGACQALEGSTNSTQSVVIVPQPTCKGCEYLYNVFTTSEINGQKLLTVSTVDMRLNSGKGQIVAQNTTLQQPTTERLASIRNDKDTTYWVISHDYNSNIFRVFHATTAGLVETSAPALGMAHDTEAKAQGYMKFSSSKNSDGKRFLAVVVPGPPKNYVELFEFDDETGELTYKRTLDLGDSPPTAYGVEFSPTGDRMFVSFQGGGGKESSLNQYDLKIADDKELVSSADTLDASNSEKYGALQLASDGKIYMAIEGSETLAIINKPDADKLIGVDYEREGVNLGGRKSNLGLPNMVQNFAQDASGPGFEANGFCTGEPTTFEAGPICDPLKDKSYVWDFGDGTSGTVTQEGKATHTYNKAGTYTVKLIQTNECTSVPSEQTITIFETPEPLTLPPFIELTCDDETTLDMGVNANNYVWIYRGRVVGRSKTIIVPKSRQGVYEAIAYNDPTADCFSGTTIDVSFRTPAQLAITGAEPICRGKSATLLAPGQSWTKYEWSTGESTSGIIVTSPGTYSVKVTDRNGCVQTDDVVITELPYPNINLAKEYFACFPLPDAETVTLDPKGVGNLTYVWSPGNATTPTITVNTPDIYTVKVTNPDGCEREESTNVQIQCEPRVFVPDAFTPQGDGQNESLQVFGAYYSNYSIRIYNRWGEVIFAAKSIEDKWDGTYKGVKVQPGVYPYVVSYEAQYFPERNPVLLRGSVMVIR